MGFYLALGDEVGLGGLPGGSPAGGVAEGEDGALAARCRGADWRAEERERRVEAHQGGLRGIVLRRVVGAAGEGHRESMASAGGGGRRRGEIVLARAWDVPWIGPRMWSFSFVGLYRALQTVFFPSPYFPPVRLIKV
jgi:hypothetical protein